MSIFSRGHTVSRIQLRVYSDLHDVLHLRQRYRVQLDFGPLHAFDELKKAVLQM
jgi:hypothetical protein